jgi:hypothetical protein
MRLVVRFAVLAAAIVLAAGSATTVANKKPEPAKVVTVSAAPSAASASPTPAATDEKGDKQLIALARIRSILDEGERIRHTLLDNAGVREYDVTGQNGDKLKVYKLITYEDSEDQLLAARAQYGAVLEKDPGNPQALLGLGAVALMEALSITTDIADEKVKQGSPDLDMENGKRGRSHLTALKGRLEAELTAAEEKFRMVLAENPSEATAHLGMAMALALRGSWPEARAKMEQLEAAGLIPLHNRSIFYAWFGFILEQGGDQQAALSRYALASQAEEPFNWALWARGREEVINEAIANQAPAPAPTSKPAGGTK